MEVGPLPGNQLSNPTTGALDLHSSLHTHHRQQNPPMDLASHAQFDAFMPVANMNCCAHQIPVVHNKSGHGSEDRGKTPTSDEDEPSLTEEGVDAHNEVGKGKGISQWHRVKWTDTMVRLLITIVSYIGEDAASQCIGGKRKLAILQKKGKWKSVSKVMSERGYDVSPQQCEDKFNDLNKRYKRLTDLLGRGTSCKVVENPTLLDYMDNLSDKKKDVARKILSSKHLYYEEMCSYHNGNRLYLPIDPALQKSVHLALRSREDREKRCHNSQEDIDEDQHEDREIDDRYDVTELINGFHDDGEEFHSVDMFPKKTKSLQDVDGSSFLNMSGSQECGGRCCRVPLALNIQPVSEDRSQSTCKPSMIKRALQLEKQKLSIRSQALELEKQSFKWQRFNMKKDRELDKLRMENERMKLENEYMALELRGKELNNECN